MTTAFQQLPSLSYVISDITHLQQKFLNPTLQILKIRLLQNNKSIKYNIILSDGTYSTNAYASNILSDRIEKGVFKRYSVVVLTSYSLFPAYNKTIIIINDMKLIQHLQTFIGAPNPLSPSNSSINLTDQKIKTESDVSNHPQSGQLLPLTSSLSQYPSSILAPVSATIVTNSSQKVDKFIKTEELFHQIKDLSPYISSWTILARVVLKTTEHEFRRNNGRMGSYFSVILKDTSGEIRGVFFDPECKQFNNSIKYKQVYKISGGVLKDNRSKKTDHEFEIMFNKTTRFEKMPEQSNIGLYPTFKFTKLAQLQNMPITSNTYVDILGYIISNSEVKQVQASSSSKSYAYRTLTICDDSGKKCELDLWEGMATDFPPDDDVVVAFKGLEVIDKKGRSLKSPEQYYYDPEIPEKGKLLQWKETVNLNRIDSITHQRTIDKGFILSLSQIDEFEELNSDCLCKCFISFTRIDNIDKLTYSACPNPTCNRKALGLNYRCETCGKTFQEPWYRYAFDFKAQDFSGSMTILFIGDNDGRLLTGFTPKEWVKRTSDLANDYDENLAVIQPHYFNMFKVQLNILRLSNKTNENAKEKQTKVMIKTIEPLNFAKGALFYAKEIRKYG